MRDTCLFLAAVLLFVASGGAMAQGQAPALQPGTGARGTIALQVADSTARYGLDALRKLEVGRGERSHARAGAGVGFVVGAGATFAFLYSGGSTSLCNRSRNQDAMAPRECLGLTAAGGLAGAGLGAAVGALFRTERVQDVPVEHLRLAVLPLRGGRPGLAFGVAF